MQSPRRRKSQGKGRHIIARSITLKDPKGKTRIYLDAGTGDGYATICLFGEDDRSIQISTSQDGGLHISLLGKRCTVSATLGMTAEEDAGLSIRDRRGLLGTMLGSVFDPGVHSLALFRDGQPYWSTPTAPRKKLPKRSGSKFKIGDTIRVVGYRPGKYPAGTKDKMGTEKLFKSMVGRSYKIKGFDQYGNIELELKRCQTVWIEPDIVELADEKPE